MDAADAADSPPEPASQLRQRGNGLLERGDWAGAEGCYRQAIALLPTDAALYVNLGFALLQQQRDDDAETMLTRALALAPLNADCHYMLGGLAERRADFDAAARHYMCAFDLKPDFELACRDACRVLSWLDRSAEARGLIEAGLRINPQFADFHFYLGNIHLMASSPEPALACYRKALALGADYSTLHGHMGFILRQQEDIANALVHLERAIALDFNNARAHYDLGILFHGQGRIDEAIAQQKIAVGMEPSLLTAHHCLLFAMSFARDCSAAEYLHRARLFGEQARSGTRPFPVRRPDLSSGRRLRVGWVSADLRRHAVASFLEGVLASLSEEGVELIAFSSTAESDAVTQRLRAVAHEWHDITQLADDQAAELIHSRNIDILVDLSGHTAQTRLPLFAWRPAPVQVSWLGYFASTGLAEMDYFLADRLSVPEASRSDFSEQVWYLPDTRLCMTPLKESADLQVVPPPALRNGYVTFGSFQALAKINDQTLHAWASVMDNVAGSRLRLQIRHLGRAGVEENLRLRLAQAGIALERVSFLDGVPYQDYFRAHHEVDLILDTFPYPGGTTTAEALWMGVPTVTLMGTSLLARQGASMLHAAGLSGWVAESPADYVRIATHWASNVHALTQLRDSLRQQVLASALFDCRRFARHLGEALHAMARECPGAPPQA